MLMNLAEDLKEYGKIKVSPMESKVGASEKTEEILGKKGAGKKPTKLEDVKKGVEKQKQQED